MVMDPVARRRKDAASLDRGVPCAPQSCGYPVVRVAIGAVRNLFILMALVGGCTSRPQGVIFADPVPEPDPLPRLAPAAPKDAAAPGQTDSGVQPATPPSPAATGPNPPVADPERARAAGFVDVFPHVRFDVERRLVEFDGFVPINVQDPHTPHVYLEAIVCTLDTRPHESLVATEARPSHVHAALLATGLEPGVPGAVVVEAGALKRTPPRGPRVEVRIAYRADKGREALAAPEDWIVNAATGARLGHDQGAPPSRWVFAGSRFVTFRGSDHYDADGSGVIVGLHTFGAEVIALESVMSPEAALEEPEWIADGNAVPPMGTPVVVRLQAR